ncbi:Ribosomal RNA small subunit methyltransferase H [Caulifigura coniformis]|uniref:Ribosomal RNA small subunit methyltransferase H n=1 Tax=Caulifigura coniformis TaxID=2527983 RepID=A0A517SGY6_9PLAN|nr:16S rRNA (cytosine(1402)-N(4))-methyltransferase RsmH [Caulifigura coniformis]QDT55381.1 Ribosomal RNA small subunit methyltransferase H [Caulifigura coniformis]
MTDTPASPSGPSPRPAVRAVHIPVLLKETLAALDLRPGMTVVDGTVGAGGHSRKILEAIRPGGTLIGVDRDSMMLRLAAENLGESPDVVLKQSSYAELDAVLDELAVPAVDRVLVDLGLSSDQLADRERGFGFKAGGPLDLRFDVRHGQPASELLRTADVQQLTDIFRDYGEDANAHRIAHAIVQGRSKSPIETAEQLARVVEQASPGRRGDTHPATRVFQALRIAVNEELEQLKRLLGDVAPRRIRSGGRLVVISFHSLEDRYVKDAFRETERWEPLTKKPVTGTPTEERLNPRSRSAKLRAAVRR